MIYVDYTNCIPQGNVKVHGGAEYARRMIKLLTNNGIETKLLVPNTYNNLIQADKELFSQCGVTVELMDSLTSYVFPTTKQILFVPLMNTKRLKEIEILKKKYPVLQVFITIHGVRLLDLKPDGFDAFYSKDKPGLLYSVVQRGRFILSKIAYSLVYKKYVPMFDGVLTVSNDSMQKIQLLCQPRDLQLFFCGSLSTDSIRKNSPKDREREDFFLFTSGGRPEKNLMRTLLAFQNYKKKTRNDMRLVVTGLQQSLIDHIKRLSIIDKQIIDKSVSLLPYVSKEELDHLYETCKCLLYPSKSEGFGLPLLDSCFHNIPCITSSKTATPEILGAAAIYVDPYSVESIEKGMIKFSNMNYDSLIESVKRAKLRVNSSIDAADADFVTYFKNLENEV